MLLGFLGALAFSILTVTLGTLYGAIAWTIWGSYVLAFFLFGYIKGKDRRRESSGETWKPARPQALDEYVQEMARKNED